MRQNKDIVIIGAGPAGLTAAYHALKEIPGINVTILEAEERVGGISASIEYHGNRMDIGGHRFFSKNGQINALWEELMPLQGRPSKDDLKLGRIFSNGGPDPEKTDAVMLVRGRVSRIFYRRKFFDYPIAIKAATFINMGFINTLKAGCSYLYSSIKKRKENSLEDFYINRFGLQLYKMFFEDYTEKVWGVHPSKLSASWGAQRVKELSILTIIREGLIRLINPAYKTNQTSLIERFHYPKFGPGQLYSIMAEKIKSMDGRIYFNSVVSKINVERGRVKEISVLNDGGEKQFRCDYLLSSMPVKDLAEALDAGSAVPLPDRVRETALGLPYRDFITVGILARKLKIRNKTKIKTVCGIVPDNWIYIQERDVKVGRLQIFNNWSPYMPADYENTVWMGLEYFCNEGDAMWNMTSDEFIQFAIDELVRINIIGREDVLDAVQQKIKKAYPAYFGSYEEFDVVREYLDGIDNLYCIGRNGQHKYNNMDHSMLTAIEAVELIKSGGSNKHRVWNVNTEEKYHEEKR
jgi:protoporphyrinogen oxidase